MTWLGQLLGNLVGAAQSAGWFSKTLPLADAESAVDLTLGTSPQDDTPTAGYSTRVGMVNTLETNDTRDWRWRDHDEDLGGVELRFSQYQPYSEGWEHDHCEFCWAKFLSPDQAKEWPRLAPRDRHVLVTEGYTTTDSYPQGAEYVWICRRCFDDFDDLVDWVVVS